MRVFAGNLRLGTPERLKTAPRASYPLINQEGILPGDSFGCEQPGAIDQDDARGADAEVEPVCIA